MRWFPGIGTWGFQHTGLIMGYTGNNWLQFFKCKTGTNTQHRDASIWMVPTTAKGFVSHEVWQKKKPSRECKQLQQTDASLINCADFTPKIHGPIRISRNPQNSPVSLIPQDAGLVGGSLSKKKRKKKNEANQWYTVYGVFEGIRKKYSDPTEQLPLL